jgi:hypothetical protein
MVAQVECYVIKVQDYTGILCSDGFYFETIILTEQTENMIDKLQSPPPKKTSRASNGVSIKLLM